MQRITTLYEKTFGTKPDAVTPLTQAGSGRRYFRVESHAVSGSHIGCIGTSERENEAFRYLSDKLRQDGLPVPQVVAYDASTLCYLQTDLGTTSLYDRLKASREAGGRYSEAEACLLEETVRLLPRFQLLGVRDIDKEKLLPPTDFTLRTVMYDLNYFKYCFLRTTPADYDEDLLQDDLEAFARALTQEAAPCLMLRDFQARNVMLCGEKPFVIDFQGARLGPPAYDLAAFLTQASARYPQELRERLVKAYVAAYQELEPLDEAAFREELRRMTLFRLLQVLGAYGLRGKFERKPHFLQSIPPALARLGQLLEAGAAERYPELERTLRQLVGESRVDAAPAKDDAVPAKEKAASPLVVRIFSFSYKKGIPEDESGNGGGYVFDCRAPHNPGRYEAYKTLTGLDEPVIRFLEEDGEIQLFLQSVFQLADFHVQRYIDRGFTSLMFSFGCTGGQHRSVYSAQHLAEHLHERFGIEVRLCHREQGIRTILPPVIK
ncbi:MAG: phosphotransferase [Alloprevotella sp.]|nr:phosphotransferase [Alloprevotella sp.]